MDVDDLKKMNSFDFIMSLGANCMVAYQLKRLGLRDFSGPIDWVINSSLENVNQMIKNRFNDYMELSNLRIIGIHEGFYSVEDMLYNTYSFHDFPVSSNDCITNYPQFRELLNRRIERFYDRISQSKSALFVREKATYDETIRLKETLSLYTKGKVNIMIINNTVENRVISQDWGIEGVYVREMPLNLNVLEIDRDQYWSEILSDDNFSNL